MSKQLEFYLQLFHLLLVFCENLEQWNVNQRSQVNIDKSQEHTGVSVWLHHFLAGTPLQPHLVPQNSQHQWSIGRDRFRSCWASSCRSRKRMCWLETIAPLLHINCDKQC